MSRTALLVVDLQREVVDDPRTHGRDETLAAVAGLLERARAAGVPVIHTRHADPDEGPREGEAGWELHDAVASAAGEAVVDKRFDDAFWRTELESCLRELGVDRIVLTGMLTEHCIGTTARSAVAHGFDVVLVADGHTTWDNDHLTGEAAVAYQNMLLDGFGTPEHEVAVARAADVVF
jgi:nicotinamidase-related amidase